MNSYATTILVKSAACSPQQVAHCARRAVGSPGVLPWTIWAAFDGLVDLSLGFREYRQVRAGELGKCRLLGRHVPPPPKHSGFPQNS